MNVFRESSEAFTPRLIRRIELGIAFVLISALSLLVAVSFQSADADVARAEALRVAIPGLTSAAVAVLLGLIALNAVFIAAETALEELRPSHVRLVRETFPDRADRLQRLLDMRLRAIAACTLGSQIMRLLILFVAFVLAERVALWLEARYTYAFSLESLIVSGLLVAIPAAILNIVLGELVPKSYASLHPANVALRLYRVIRVATFLLSIPAKLLVAAAGLFTARFGGRAGFSAAEQAEEEIKTLVDSAQESGSLEAEEQELLHSVFEFADTVAREIMTPRVDMDAMPVTSTADEVLEVVRESGHSRIPLYEGTDDQIVGIIHAKDLLMAMVERSGPLNLRTLMRPVVFVPENKDLHELLGELRQSRTQMAVVQDEFGGTAGIVTIEDIVEELVGDIVDEYDEEEEAVVSSGAGFLVDGKLHLDDVNDEVGSTLESDEFDTIGGYVFGIFGRQPKEGEAVIADGYRFTVAETDGRRIQKLLIEKADHAEISQEIGA